MGMMGRTPVPDRAMDSGRGPRVVVVGAASPGPAVVVAGLADGGLEPAAVLPADTGLLPRIEAIAPDAVIAVLEGADAAALGAVLDLARTGRVAVAVFTDRTDPASTASAVEAGVGAYVVDGLRPDRVRPVLDTAIARFRALARLRRERDEAVGALAERKVIEKAKGLLMQQRGMTEEEAYAALRKAAMKQGRRIADIAESVITAAGVGR